MAMEEKAICSNCKGTAFLIHEESVICIFCKTKYKFEFMDDAHILCETKANDLVKIINEGV